MSALPTSRELLDAVRHPSRIEPLRVRFSGLDVGSSIPALGREVVDPQLVRVVLGPVLAPSWLPPLEALYARFRARHPAHFHEIDAAWRRQRAVWHGSVRAAARTGAIEIHAAHRVSGPEAAVPSPPSRPDRPAGRPRPSQRPSSAGLADSFFNGSGACGVSRLLQALLHSPAAVDDLRQKWTRSCGPCSDWDGWVFPSDLAIFVQGRSAPPPPAAGS